MGFFIAEYARSATVVVAASDSRDKTGADYICDGTDDQVEINAALNALPVGGGMVVLLEGTFHITGTITIPKNNVALVGQGAGTVLRIPNGHNASLNVISGVSINHVLVSNLKIDGNRANQTTGHMRGIYFETVTHSKIADCWVENMRRDGIRLNTTSNSNTITGNTCQGNTGNSILLYQSSNNTVTGNTCQANIGFGIQGILLSESSNNTVTGNTCQGNGGNGILVEKSSNNTITGNTCQGSSDWSGIALSQSSNNTVTGNTCQGNGEYGIRITVNSNSNTIIGNTVAGNSQKTDAAYDGIYLHYDSNYNNIQGNTVRRGTGANQQRYGINVSDAASDGNLVIDNDIYLAGRTGDYNDAGTLTIYHDNRTTVGWVP